MAFQTLTLQNMQPGRLRQSCSPGEPPPVFPFNSVFSISDTACPMKSDSRELRNGCGKTFLTGTLDYGSLVGQSTGARTAIAGKGTGCVGRPALPGAPGRALRVPGVSMSVGDDSRRSDSARPWVLRPPLVLSAPGCRTNSQLAEATQKPSIEHSTRRAGGDAASGSQCPLDCVPKVVVEMNGTEHPAVQEALGCAAVQRGAIPSFRGASPSSIQYEFPASPKVVISPQRGRGRQPKPILAASEELGWHSARGCSSIGSCLGYGQRGRSKASGDSADTKRVSVGSARFSDAAGEGMVSCELRPTSLTTTSESSPAHGSGGRNFLPADHGKPVVKDDPVPVAIEDFLGEGVPELFTRSMSDASSSDLSGSLSPCLPYYAAVAAATGQGLPFSTRGLDWDCYVRSPDSRFSQTEDSRDSSVTVATESGNSTCAGLPPASGRRAREGSEEAVPCCPRCGGRLSLTDYVSEVGAAGASGSAVQWLNSSGHMESLASQGERTDRDSKAEYQGDDAACRTTGKRADTGGSHASESSWEDVEEEALREAAKAGIAYASALGLRGPYRCVKKLEASTNTSKGDSGPSGQRARQDAEHPKLINLGQSPKAAGPPLTASSGVLWNHRGGLVLKDGQRMSFPEGCYQEPPVSNGSESRCPPVDLPGEYPWQQNSGNNFSNVLSETEGVRTSYTRLSPTVRSKNCLRISSEILSDYPRG
ncbi:hypothetical protein CSUI_010442 [Cystoisospora suis]|uniref:Uncharacterized protein n=1 Tax=Cystoisospora suis TaxID=483139 RepID=A0A2C6KGY0_9APIC|nr:hypothetical protein CSUI_010442 [Cystoisospora suis]